MSYLRNIYALERLAPKNSNYVICADESLFTHKEGEQTWVLGLINLENNDIRLEIISNRNEATLKSIIEKHMGIGNTVYTDSWLGYNFLHSRKFRIYS